MTVSQETLDRNIQRIEEHLSAYRRYKEIVKGLDISSFMNKSRQKEALELISRCFEELADADNMTLLPLVWENNLDAENVYYNFPNNPYQFNEKKQKLVKDFCPHFDELLNLRELWLQTKNAPINPKKTTEQLQIEKKEQILKTIDYSKITDMNKWQKTIDEMIEDIDKIITPKYDKKATELIKFADLYNRYLQDKSLITELDETFYKWREMVSSIVGKDNESIKKMVNSWKELELLNIRILIQETLNFDLNTVKLDCYSDGYRTWIINNEKLFKIERIIAGGYNIQRLHNRVLVKLTKI